MDSVSETRLSLVAPPLADKTRQLVAALDANGVYARIVQALRTWAEQDALYAQGRTAPGRVVTNVRGGYSWHNFGLAVDLVPSEFGPDTPYSPDWNRQHPAWLEMETKGKMLGLEVGAEWRTFPDAPHFQLTGIFPEDGPTDEVREIFESSGMAGVWAAARI